MAESPACFSNPTRSNCRMPVTVIAKDTAARRWKRWLAFAMLTGIALLTCRLGFWQLDRAQEKTELAEARLAAESKDAVEISELTVADLESRVGQRLQVRVNEELPTWYLDHRSFKGQAGMYVFGLLPVKSDPADMKSRVLLLRGWQAKDPRQAQGIQDKGKMSLGYAVVRVEPESHHAASRLGLSDRVAGEHLQHWLAIDSRVMSEKSGYRLAPFVLRQLGPSSDERGVLLDDGLVRDWPEPADGVQKHKAYAFQWFLFCGLALFLALAVLFPWRRKEVLSP